MLSLEHCDGYTPVDITGGSNSSPIKRENSQQDFLPKESFTATELSFSSSPKFSSNASQSNVRRLPVTDDPALLSDTVFDVSPGGEPSPQYANLADLPNQEGSERTNSSERKQFIWDVDLSKNGQKLYLLLLGDIGFTKYLPELAQSEEIDLGTGLQELRDQGILDESTPKMLRIKR